MKRIKIVLLSKYFFFTLFLISLFYSFIVTKCFKYPSKYPSNTTSFNLKIIDYKIDGNLFKATVKGKEKLILTYYFNSEEEKEYYLKNISYGMYMEVRGTLSKASKNTIPNTFNYQEYLTNHKINYILQAQDIKMQKSNNILNKLKNYVNNRINQSSNKDYLQTFILGNKDYLESTTLDNFKNNGVSHLFAISGMHLSFFALFLGYLLTFFKVNKKVQNILIIIVLSFYSFMANFTPSITRALIFFILITLNRELKLNITSLNLLFLTFIIMIGINPFYIYDLGFIYSFITTFTIIYISKHLEGKSKLSQTFNISLICFLASLPVTLSNFYEINFFSIIANIILTPLISFIIYPLSLLSLFFPLDFLLNIFLNILDLLNNLFASFTLLKVVIPMSNVLFIVVYYLVFFIFLKTLNYKYLCYLLLILFIAYLIPKLDSKAFVYYLDVGQGDSSLIISPYQKEVILIDTGGKVSFNNEQWQERKDKYYVTDNTITLLKSLGISRIDNLILTHGDYDHIGEASYLVENYKVKKVIFNYDEFNDLEKDLIKGLTKYHIKYYQGLNNLNTSKYQLNFLNSKKYDNENDNSNVIYFNYEGLKFLFMGDAEVEREKDILQKYNLKNINFLKVGHHGSDTSSSKEFIDSIKPKISIISVGKNNRYGHPSLETLNNLAGSKIYRTDFDGTIKISLNKNKYTLSTYPG